MASLSTGPQATFKQSDFDNGNLEEVPLRIREHLQTFFLWLPSNE